MKVSLVRFAVAAVLLPSVAAAGAVTTRRATQPVPPPRRPILTPSSFTTSLSWSAAPVLLAPPRISLASPLGRTPWFVSGLSEPSPTATRFWVSSPQPLLLPWTLAWLRVGEPRLPSQLDTEGDESVSTGDAAEAEEGRRELSWLVRHKRRSVLESRRPGWTSSNEPVESLALDRLAPWLPDVVATLEYAASPAQQAEDGEAEPSAHLMRLEGRAPHGHWLLGGVVYPSSTSRWRALSQATLQPLRGHELLVATAWANRPLVPGPLEDQAANQTLEGAVLVMDRWQVVPALAVSAGARYSHAGFAEDPHHVDPAGTVEWSPVRRATLRASVSSRTLIPGGGSLSLPLFEPIIPVLGDTRVGRALRYELQAECEAGSTRLATRAFHRAIQDPFITAILDPETQARTIPAGQHLDLRGVGVSVSQRFGGFLQGSLSYSLTRAERLALRDSEALLVAQDLLVPEGTFHDVVGRLATHIDPTDTHVLAFSRVVATREGSRFRYEVQVRQVLPFIARKTGTEWTVVVAVRNLLQEAQEDDGLEEIADASPPRRVIGGVSVRF